jgi:DNA-binding NarL/FixJ family response regulator
MDPVDRFSIQCLVILKADRLHAELLRDHSVRVFPHANISIVGSVEAAAIALTTEAVDLLVTGLGASVEGDVLDLLARCANHPSRPRRVLVVTGCREHRYLAALRTLAVDGVFDCVEEEAQQLSFALRQVGNGCRYWSPSVTEHMRRLGSTSTALFRMLTLFEQVVLSVVGGGCDDAVAARELGLSPSTVSTVRRELHRKLGVQHRGELVRVAAQQGFVRFTPTGVVRPGFEMLSAAYQSRRAKQHDSAAPPLQLACARR